jgi:ElaB/YqjD/DUF883 family membrane-anchored ribosome-binding protein
MNDTTHAMGSDEGTTAPQRDKLMSDLKVLIADAEELLRATAGQTSNGAAALRGRVQDTLERAKASLAETQAEAIARAKAAGQAADTYVHDNPWKAIGAAAGIGLLIGLLMSRR